MIAINTALIKFPYRVRTLRRNAHKSLKVAQAAQESSDLSDPRAAARRVAEAHRCLGRNLFALDRYGKAYKYFEEASRLFQSLPDLALAGECAMDSLRMWRFMKRAGNDELESRVQEAQANLSHDRNDRYHVARGLLGFGEFLWWRKRRTEAIQPLYEASKIFEDLNCSASAAQSLHYLARTYARLEELSKALLVSRDALAKAEECGETGLLCSALKITAIYLMASEAYDDALPSITQALAASRSVGYPNGIAQSLELMAYNCAARMDLSGARIAYEGARAHFAKRGSARIGSRGVARCAENVEKLRQLPELNQDSFANLTKPVPWY